MDILKVDALARQKNSKRHFLDDISKPFQEVTLMGPEPHQFFSFSNILANMVARGIQSFPKWAVDGRLIEQRPNFFSQICANMR